MSNFDIGATIKTSFLVAKAHWKTAFSISMKPLLVLLAVITASLALQFAALIDAMWQGDSIFEFDFALRSQNGVTVALLFVLDLVGYIAATAIVLNWQSFLILDNRAAIAARKKGSLPDYLKQEVWRARFKKYIVRQLFIMLCMALIYIPIVGLVLLLGPGGAMFLPLLVFAIIIAAIPYLFRILMAFPMIASDAEGSRFTAALALTKGMGWRIFLTHLGVMVILCVCTFIFMLAVMIVLGILSAIWGGLGIIAFVVVVLILIPFMFALNLMITGTIALIYIQLAPEHARRWAELSGRGSVTKPRF